MLICDIHQALAKGSHIPVEGTINVSWRKQIISLPDNTTTGGGDGAPNVRESEDRPVSPRLEDSYEQSGWGDEDGMGM